MATTIAVEVDVKTGDASDDILALREELEKVKTTQKELGDQFKAGFEAAEKGAGGAKKGMKSLGGGISSVLKSLGLIAIAVQVFMFLKDLLMKNQKVMDALSTATVAFEIIMHKVMDAVMGLAEPMQAAFSDPKQAVLDLWEAIKTNFINRLEGLVVAATSVGKVLKGVFELDWDVIKEGATDYASALVQIGTGFDREQQEAMINGVKEFAIEAANATVAAVNQADALVELRNEVTLLEAGQKKVQLTYQRDAELQRQARDDIRLTLAERIEANDKLGTILDNQIKEEQVLADKRLELAKREQEVSGITVESKAAILIAEGEVADLKERIVGQESEQLTNQAALEKELFDLQQELRIATLDERALELEELDVYYEALADKAKKASDTSIDIGAAKKKALEDLNAKFIREDLKKEQDATNKRIAMQNKEKDARLGAASAMISGIGSLVQSLGDQSKEAIVIQKALAIAQIAIDTARSIVAGIAGATTSASATGPGAFVATPIFIATTIATILAAVGSATAILNGAGGGGGSATVPSITTPTATTAPAMQQATSGTTELGGAEQAQLAPIQAFVVETEVTGNQNNVNQIESQANFG
tara:strand:+ start:295 stop:2076 length:1782 start_codon:yes stop_codon:yes gene_type:complete